MRATSRLLIVFSTLSLLLCGTWTAKGRDGEPPAIPADQLAILDAFWQTIEAPHDLALALEAVPAGVPVLVDCLTLWLSNRMLADVDMDAEIGHFEEALDRRAGTVVLVSNEVGFGIVPDNALARRFRDLQGRLNQRIAARADRVILVVAFVSSPIRI